MNLSDRVERAIRTATRHTFSTMLGVELTEHSCAAATEAYEPKDGVVAVLGLAGAWMGTGCITCSPGLACHLCSRLLMATIDSVDDGVLDAVAELANIIIGGVKTDLEQDLGPLGLSLPTVVYGRNLHTRSTRPNQWTAVCFWWGDQCLMVQMCLSPRRQTTLPVRLAGSPATLEISNNQERSSTWHKQE